MRCAILSVGRHLALFHLQKTTWNARVLINAYKRIPRSKPKLNRQTPFTAKTNGVGYPLKALWSPISSQMSKAANVSQHFFEEVGKNTANAAGLAETRPEEHRYLRHNPNVDTPNSQIIWSPMVITLQSLKGNICPLNSKEAKFEEFSCLFVFFFKLSERLVSKSLQVFSPATHSVTTAPPYLWPWTLVLWVLTFLPDLAWFWRNVKACHTTTTVSDFKMHQSTSCNCTSIVNASTTADLHARKNVPTGRVNC